MLAMPPDGGALQFTFRQGLCRITFARLARSEQQFLAASATIVLEGSPTSYAQFRQWSGFSDGGGGGSSSSSAAAANATIEVDFRTEQADCLLLYADSRDGRYLQGPHRSDLLM